MASMTARLCAIRRRASGARTAGGGYPARMSHVPARVEQLMALASGDEKHDPSAHSTLDILWVLYDRILRYDPRDPRSEDRDRFLMSKGHGPLALFAKGSDRRVFVLIGDGEANEGSVWETAMLAGSLELPHLTAILVDNASSTRPLGDIAAKFAAFGWAARALRGRGPGAPSAGPPAP